MLLMGNIIAWAMVVLGGLRVGIGFYVAKTFTDPEAYAAATARYIGSKTSGEAIDQGLVWIAVGIAFGLLARIAGKRTS